MSTSSLFAVLASAAWLIALALLIALHLRPPTRNVVRDPVSDYGVGASRPLFQMYGWAGNVGVLALSAAAYTRQAPALPGWLPAGLLALLVCRLGLLVFPTDLEGAPRTSAGRLHMVLAIAQFAIAYTVIDNATPLLAAAFSAPWPALLGTLRWVAAASLAALVACLVLRPLRAFFGLAERVFLVAVALWFLSAALALT
ncbi:DUF998 domain-containing protein [Ottowia sp.]|uniref:DUF998 domain-containing protein n=1 Tax=Ottowia sp. TaxID=1898956 RepID=UPI002CBA9372|nr:DUF998 domain-containing protein [Ottowia sp.]HOB65884.1 DUF998 domain-containing protein [Ottowia sp.]HPZ56867.1 DUF998 domain-containing protein [Ottowia sp.]HQD47280.1 DUF998 domain-containing protein [Ottowia sp.]